MNLNAYASLSQFPGLKSGVYTSAGLIPHALFLIVLKMFNAPLPSIWFLVMFTIGAKLLGEYFFWNGWKDCTKAANGGYFFDPPERVAFSNPNIIIAIVGYLLDISMEAVLIFWSLNASIAPLTVFLSLLLCQIVSSPLQGFFSDYYNRKNQLYFALGVGLIVLANMYQVINGKDSGHSPLSLINLFCLDSFRTSTCIILLLCLKGLMGNISVIARILLAEAMEERMRKI